MATIAKRGQNFRIKVSLGYDLNGKQIIKSTTFTPPPSVTDSKAKNWHRNMLLNLSVIAKVTLPSMRI